MRFNLYLIIIIIAIVLVSGCTKQEASEEKSEAECKMPMDCEGRMHVQCVGMWQCIDSKCNWQCSGEHLELPKEESEGMTG